MQLSTILGFGLLLRVVIATPVRAVARGQNDAAEAYYNAFNKEFLITSGSDVYYKSKINDPTRDGTWSASLDILGAEDAYERTGDPDKKTLVNNLLTTWLKYNPEQASSTPWSWDGWNDDIGWFTLALIRGYQITGTQQFLDAAKNGFDYAFSRGWETAHNDGGIWEEQPDASAKENPPRDATKEALANDSLGKVACMIYQSTHDQNYLNKCQQIYNWVLSHIYNAQTGQIDTGVDQSGKIDTGSAAYNQGTFLDYSNLLYTITGNGTIYTIAQKAAAFARTDPSLTKNGIFSNSADYLNTWADEMARGVGHFVRDNRLWGTYYTWMSSNAASILKNRRTDKGITWNAWDTPTPVNDTYTTNKFVSALAWLQFTPPTQPSDVGGVRIISNQKTGLAIDSLGKFGNGQGVVQWGANRGLNQRWQLTQNSDFSWNIVNVATWQTLDCPGATTDDRAAMVQWQPSRSGNQRWMIDAQGDGTYRIKNQASGKVLDGASSTGNGARLIQFGWNGQGQQKWVLS